MKKSVGILAALAVALVVTAAYAIDNGPATIEINAGQAKMAPVPFQHHEHQTRVEGKCVTCHHKTADGEQPASCASCHGKVDGAPDYKKAMHTRCQACHKEQKAAGKNPPLKCTECHVKK